VFWNITDRGQDAIPSLASTYRETDHRSRLRE